MTMPNHTLPSHTIWPDWEPPQTPDIDRQRKLDVDYRVPTEHVFDDGSTGTIYPATLSRWDDSAKRWVEVQRIWINVDSERRPLEPDAIVCEG